MPGGRLDVHLCLDQRPDGPSHGLGHQFGDRNEVPHGVTSCTMLPRLMEFNRSLTDPHHLLIAEAMGVDTRNDD